MTAASVAVAVAIVLVPELVPVVVPEPTPPPANDVQPAEIEEPYPEQEVPTLDLLRARGRYTLPIPNSGHLRRDERRAGALAIYPDVDRPKVRGDCADASRPCPFVSCRYHLYLDVNEETGSIKFNFPQLEPWELKETCALDVADRDGITLEKVAELLALTRERVRQIEALALDRAGRRNPDAAKHLDGAVISTSHGLGQSPFMSGEGQ